MAHYFTEDNGHSFLAKAGDNCTNFDLFDHGLHYNSAEVSDTSVSNGSSTTDATLDDFSLGSAIWDRDPFAPRSEVYPNSLLHQQTTAGFHPQSAPKPQRLVYRMRSEAMPISHGSFMAFENYHDTGPLTAFRQTFHDPSPSTPPRTPQSNRTYPNTPSTRHARMHRVEKTPSHSRSTSSMAQYRSSSPPTMSSKHLHRQQQTPVTSPSADEWTERVRRYAIQSPNFNNGLPVSPPTSIKIFQNDNPAITAANSQEGVLDITDDIFGPSLSATTTASSFTQSQHHLIDDIYSSTGSSSFDLDSDTKLFGIEEDDWNYTHSPTRSGSGQIDLENLCTSLSPPHYNDLGNTEMNTPSHNGLGISFANSDFSHDMQSFNCSTVEPLDAQLKVHPSSVKLPAMHFNTPANDFGSPVLRGSARAQSYSPSPAPRIARNLTGSSHSASTSISISISTPLPTSRNHQRNKSSTSSSVRGGSRSGTNKGRNSKSAKVDTSGGLGFVNYTPEDRNKILTGVAPSGSSKTKARREKEALDRRRKLSEAARRLVGEAGGDVEAVDRELSE